MPAKIEKELRHLKGWQYQNSALRKEFVFANFAEAMDFMNRLVPVAENLNHHPDWTNSYNRVTMHLTSHSAGGLTEKDFVLARAADLAALNMVGETL